MYGYLYTFSFEHMCALQTYQHFNSFRFYSSVIKTCLFCLECSFDLLILSRTSSFSLNILHLLKINRNYVIFCFFLCFFFCAPAFGPNPLPYMRACVCLHKHLFCLLYAHFINTYTSYTSYSLFMANARRIYKSLAEIFLY